MSDIHIGISGWRYAPWRKAFYPEGLAQKHELAFASRAVNSIEINGSFYALQTPQRYAEWRDDTPDGFVFAVKAPRYITHVRRLKDIDEPLANFFASGPLQLGDKLGPILWQFPPSLKFDAQRFSDFLQRLPHDRHAASQCARHCAARLKKDGAFDARDLLHRLKLDAHLQTEPGKPPSLAVMTRFGRRPCEPTPSRMPARA